MERKDSGNVGEHIIVMLIAGAFTLALIAVAAWSLQQTVAFFENALRTSFMGLALGIIVQFGQNFVIYMANTRSGSANARIVWYIIWGVLAAIDAGTNCDQWARENQSYVNNPGNMLGTLIIYIGLCLIVFVEEIIAASLGWFLVNLNHVIVDLGGSSIPALEVAGNKISNAGFRRQAA